MEVNFDAVLLADQGNLLIRLDIEHHVLSVRAVGENDEPGVGAALQKVQELEQRCIAAGIQHEALQRRGKDGGKCTDAIVITVLTK